MDFIFKVNEGTNRRIDRWFAVCEECLKRP